MTGPLLTNKDVWSNKKIQYSLREKTEKLRATVLLPKIKSLISNHRHLSAIEQLREISQLEHLGNEICCQSKPSFTMEEAVIASATREICLDIYICKCCGYVHFGHSHDKSTLTKIKISAINTIKNKERRKNNRNVHFSIDW